MPPRGHMRARVSPAALTHQERPPGGHGERPAAPLGSLQHLLQRREQLEE